MGPCSLGARRCWRLLSSTRFFKQALITQGPFAGLAGLQSEPIFFEAPFALGDEHRIFSGARRGFGTTDRVFLLAPLTVGASRLCLTLKFGRIALPLQAYLLGSLDPGLEGLQIVECLRRLGRTRGGTLLERSCSSLIELQRRAFTQGLIGGHLDGIDTTVDKKLSGHHIGEATRHQKAAIAGNPLSQQGIIGLIARQPRRLACDLCGLDIHRTRHIESLED